MSRPKYINIIGILIIVFGLFRFFNFYQLRTMPETLAEVSRTMEKLSSDSITSIDDTIEMAGIKLRVKEDSLNKVDNMGWMKEIFDMTSTPSDYFIKWVRPLGNAGMMVMIIYLLGGIVLLLARPYSPMVAYITLGISVLFYAAVFIIMLSDRSDSYLSHSVAFNRIFAIVFDLIMLGYLIGGDKDYFKREEISE